ncbi:MAG: hypothetical protein HUU54_05675 [Ignavibacteriaceae bacterium]|nr:hypothetical protein [Ignavibacteriaceae bacterium]
MKKIGIFFGAGAEVSYGLPSGGKFALELFRQNVSNLKTELHNQLNYKINEKDIYATEWLPKDYKNKRIHAFGKNEFGDLIESTIEVNRSRIISLLDNFDLLFRNAAKELRIEETLLETKFGKLTGKSIGEETYSQVVQINEMLAKQSKLFESIYFSSILDLLKSGTAQNEISTNILRRYAGAFLQLFVGAHGQELIQKLNQDLFTKAPDDIPIFDDIFGMFRIEYSKAGLIAIELLLETKQANSKNEALENYLECECTDLFVKVCQKVLDSLFCDILDYQGLIDSHFRYLFSPQKEWAKFTKMILFLRSAHSLIKANIADKQYLNDGYYSDLRNCAEYDLEINAIGTSNYNNIIENVLEGKILNKIKHIYHLNGAVTDYFNPYKNTVTNYSDIDFVPQNQILVPFILTQSGLKPLTSVSISRRYVELFDKLKNSDAIIVIGYNFNTDDSHINGLFRELIEIEGKKLFWVNIKEDTKDIRRELMINLRLDMKFKENIQVICVNPDTRLQKNDIWLKVVSNLLTPKL